MFGPTCPRSCYAEMSYKIPCCQFIAGCCNIEKVGRARLVQEAFCSRVSRTLSDASLKPSNLDNVLRNENTVLPRRLIVTRNITKRICCFSLLAWSGLASDLSGTWDLTVSPKSGPVDKPVVVLTQSGDKLIGIYKSPAIGEFDVMGTVQSPTITFSFDTPRGPAMFKGTLDSDERKITGTFSAGGDKGASFSATKRESK